MIHDRFIRKENERKKGKKKKNKNDYLACEPYHQHVWSVGREEERGILYDHEMGAKCLLHLSADLDKFVYSHFLGHS